MFNLKETEEICLGLLLKNPQNFALVGNTLLASDFFYPQHQAIFSDLKALLKEGETSESTCSFVETPRYAAYLNALKEKAKAAKESLLTYANLIRYYSLLRHAPF